jgi:hypothetical protein
VKIEAQFKVGEYEIVILSAKDSTGLDRWLGRTSTTSLRGAEPLLRPMSRGDVLLRGQGGLEKVKEGDQGACRRCGFTMTPKTSSCRSGWGCSTRRAAGPDRAHPGARTSATRWPIIRTRHPDEPGRGRQGAGSLRGVHTPRSMTRRSRSPRGDHGVCLGRGTCDPCPGPTLDGAGLPDAGRGRAAGGAQYGRCADAAARPLHQGHQATEDLVFKAAPPIAGGREHLTVDKNELEEGAVPASVNNFQGRYAIRHVWEGKSQCLAPSSPRPLIFLWGALFRHLVKS